jgi:nitrogen regulatory protein PII
MSDRFSLNPDAPIPEGRREAYEYMAKLVKDTIFETNQLVHRFVDKLEATKRAGTMTDTEIYQCLVVGCAEITHELKHCLLELEQVVGQPLQRDAIDYLKGLECGVFNPKSKLAQMVGEAGDEPVDPAVEALINALIKQGQ